MKAGRAFEILVKQILLHVGFSEVKSDGLYIFDAGAGKMIQGLGEAHNADVLLEPPVQTPFYSMSRILIECKDYKKKVGLNTVRSVLGLKEDINHFDIVDKDELIARRNTRRKGLTYPFERYDYQVAIAAMNGYTVPAQKFAATYRIPLLEFNQMPYWAEFCDILHKEELNEGNPETEYRIRLLADRIGKRTAVAITNSGQLLFLYCISGEKRFDQEMYTLHWDRQGAPWRLRCGKSTYAFQLPESIFRLWLSKSTDELSRKKEALHCKTEFFSNMLVYYRDLESGVPAIKMISIDRYELEQAMERLGGE